MEKQAGLLENSEPGSKDPDFVKLNNSLAALFDVLQQSDMPPTKQSIATAVELKKLFEQLVTKWTELKSKQ